MIDVGKLRGLIAEKGMSQRQLAKNLGMVEKTFYSKMKKAVFDSNEMDAMISILEIKDPASVFFANSVAYHATNITDSA